MNSVKVLHCADFHIGAERLVLGSRSRTRKAEIRKCFHRILDLCRTEQVKLLLIAGDLFDHVNVSRDILEDIRDGIAALSETTVVISSGNHDPATPDSPYLFEGFWPQNAILFTSQASIVELPKLGVRLVGAGFTGTYCYNSLFRQVSLPKDSMINIGVLHAELVSDNGRSDYNALSLRQIGNSNLHYLALGHIHKRTKVQKEGNTYYAYSGCPEGQGFDETGDKGVYIGTISTDECRMEYRSLCTRKYIELNVDVSIAVNRQEILEIIRSALRAESGDEYREQLYRITLVGEPDEGVVKSTEDIVADLSDIWYLQVKDCTRPRLCLDELRRENSLRGVFVRQMDKLRGEIPEECREMALRLGLKAFYGEIGEYR